MEIYFKKNLRENIDTIIRRAGYAKIFDRRSRQTSYVRRLSSLFYPRFHLYIKEESDQFILNLHLDQKRPSYRGQTAHSGEYSGEIIKAEAERIKDFFKDYLV
jgi:hypothetical protein